jgi:hypothetical protein
MDIGIGLPNAVPGVDRDIPASKDPAQVDLLADAVGLGS